VNHEDLCGLDANAGHMPPICHLTGCFTPVRGGHYRRSRSFVLLGAGGRGGGHNHRQQRQEGAKNAWKIQIARRHGAPRFATAQPTGGSISANYHRAEMATGRPATVEPPCRPFFADRK